MMTNIKSLIKEHAILKKKTSINHQAIGEYYRPLIAKAKKERDFKALSNILDEMPEVYMKIYAYIAMRKIIPDNLNNES